MGCDESSSMKSCQQAIMSSLRSSQIVCKRYARAGPAYKADDRVVVATKLGHSRLVRCLLQYLQQFQPDLLG